MWLATAAMKASCSALTAAEAAAACSAACSLACCAAAASWSLDTAGCGGRKCFVCLSGAIQKATNSFLVTHRWPQASVEKGRASNPEKTVSAYSCWLRKLSIPHT
jgi:hypothetical protein